MIRNLITAILILFTYKVFSQEPECSKVKSRIILNKKSTTSDIRELDYDVKYVKLDLKLTNKNQYISGNVLTKASVTATILNNWVFELHPNLIIDSIKILSKKLTYTRSGNYVDAALDKTYQKNNLFEATVFYHGFSPSGGFFNGYSSDISPTWNTRASWSLSEPYNAHHWWACKQVLTDHIDSSDVWITCDTSQMGGSNGTLQKIVKLDTLHRFEWKNRTPIAYYLISVAVSNYVDYSYTVNIPGIAKPVLIQNYVYRNPQTLQNFKSEIDKTGDIIKYFSQKYGNYPFWKDKYGHCMAPFGGGMEHQTMTSLGTFNTNLIAHELAHQWWGDNVTCKTWKDIWLNEGFARYSEVLYSEKTNPKYARQQMDEYHTSAMYAIDGSIYVDDTTNPSRIFSTRLTYNKGAAIIHNIRYEINNDSLFFLILKNFQITYSNKNASIADLRDFIQKETKRDWTVFFYQWIYKEGYPTYNVHYRTDKKNGLIQIRQTTSKPSSVMIFKGNIDLKIHLKTKDTLIRLNVQSDSQTFVLYNTDTIKVLDIDPNQWVLNDTGIIVYDSLLKAPPKVEVESIKKKTSFNIYPNPCDEKLIITNEQSIKKWEIFDIKGEKISSGIIDKNNEINTSEIPSGIYFIRLNLINYPLIIIHK